jgi:hypothetical protein
LNASPSTVGLTRFASDQKYSFAIYINRLIKASDVDLHCFDRRPIPLL